MTIQIIKRVSYGGPVREEPSNFEPIEDMGVVINELRNRGNLRRKRNSTFLEVPIHPGEEVVISFRNILSCCGKVVVISRYPSDYFRTQTYSSGIRGCTNCKDKNVIHLSVPCPIHSVFDEQYARFLLWQYRGSKISILRDLKHKENCPLCRHERARSLSVDKNLLQLPGIKRVGGRIAGGAELNRGRKNKDADYLKIFGRGR
ncbi:MAG: hypothetical protein ACW99U_12875 [Candidatus Thorarchaeota archaeon]|jgi:hypothetical protein